MRPTCLAIISAALALPLCSARGDVAPPNRRQQGSPPASDPAPKVQQEQKADIPAVPELKPGELLTRHRSKLKVTASSFWPGWPPEKAIDGDPATSWFSQTADAAALKTTPWVEVTFPEDVTVQHVLALGNREPSWPVNYSIVVAKIELYDAGGRLVRSQNNETAVPTFDIEFHFKAPVAKVRRLRFVSVADQGDKNPFKDIAIGELRAW